MKRGRPLTNIPDVRERTQKEIEAELRSMPREEVAYRALRILRPLVLGLKRTLESPEGISVAMRDVLDVIRRVPDRATVPFLARVMLLDRQPVANTVNKLLRAGLVEPLENPAHLRSPLLRLTELGAKELERIRSAELKALRSMVEPLSQKELLNCLAVLEHLHVEFAIRVMKSEQPSRGSK